MKITIESTEQIIELAKNVNGRELSIVGEARVWKGVTDGGVECHLLVTRVAVDRDADTAQFEKELQERHVPRVEDGPWDMRLIL